MPKKRKRPRKQDRPRNHPGRSNAERSQESLFGAFARWVREQHPKADATEYEDVARTAVELKANRLGEPSPADWNEDLIEVVVGELMPANVLADDDYARAVVPGMRADVECLAESGRFPRDENSRRRALRVLDELEPTMVERFRGTDNKSMAGRTAALAMGEGVDITDEAQFEAFIERFNSMPQEWREHITGGPTRRRLRRTPTRYSTSTPYSTLTRRTWGMRHCRASTSSYRMRRTSSPRWTNCRSFDR